MKKILPLSTIVLALALGGCNGTPDEKSRDDQEQQTNKTEQTTPKPHDYLADSLASENKRADSLITIDNTYKRTIDSVAHDADLMFGEYPSKTNIDETRYYVSKSQGSTHFSIEKTLMSFKGKIKSKMFVDSHIDYEDRGIDTTGWTIDNSIEQNYGIMFTKDAEVVTSFDSTRNRNPNDEKKHIGIFTLEAHAGNKIIKYILNGTIYEGEGSAFEELFELQKIEVSNGNNKSTYTSENTRGDKQLEKTWSWQENNILPAYLSAIQRTLTEKAINDLK